jgi:hypothetical protein
VPDLPFVGSEARAAGILNRHRLRSNFTRLHPDVYLPADIAEPPLEHRIHAAWLWSQREGVVAGSAAAFLHGTRWVDRETPVELIHRNPRAPAGVIVRRDLLLDGEVTAAGALPVTTPARTAFDLGRRKTLTQAVSDVDALMRATGVSSDAIAALARTHRRARGLRHLECVLSLADPGSQSPKESWLRLVLIRAGLPRPQTQIPVPDAGGFPTAYLDLGWPEVKVAVEYDGEHHRTDRHQYVKDIRRRERLEQMGWIIITVVAEDRPSDIIRRVRQALARRSTVR